MSRASPATDSFLPDNSPDQPSDFFERRARRRGAEWVAGVDEVGRGPLAGPVVVAAVMFEGRRFPHGLNDSKMLAPDERDRLYEKILSRGLVAVVSASRERVDRMNILRASLWAMSKAIRALPQQPDYVLVDGNMIPPGLRCESEALVSGDSRSVSIAAASIVAKVTRDRLMRRVGQAFPEYGFEQHKGYSTPGHFAALSEHGPCRYHRRSFAPVRERLELMTDTEPTLWGSDQTNVAAP